MSDEWKLGIGVYDTFDRDWTLCHDFSKRPHNPHSGTKEELIKLCIKMNIDAGHTEDIVKHNFTDHYGVIRYRLGEHGLIARCSEIWCPYHHKGEFGELVVVPKQQGEG